MDTEIVLKNLGKNIRDLRKSKKMTIDELAEKSSISSKYLQGVEVGNKNISIKKLNKICKALETSPEILFNIKSCTIKKSEEKIFAISEKLKKFEEFKLDFIGNMLDQLNDIMTKNNNEKDIDDNCNNSN